MLSKQGLIDFEEDIANCFNSGLIKAPTHLYSGNEDEIISVFSKFNISKKDWVLCSWRSHYQCLLKGVPKKELKQAILDGKSITLCFPKYRIFSSAIVGGVLPIAVGIGLAIKRKNLNERAFVFSGDMTAQTGGFYESIKYVYGENLPVHFIIEDNNKSVCTPTDKVWNEKIYPEKYKNLITYYKYESKYPHCGAGLRVQF